MWEAKAFEHQGEVLTRPRPHLLVTPCYRQQGGSELPFATPQTLAVDPLVTEEDLDGCSWTKIWKLEMEQQSFGKSLKDGIW
jgi:hypothetical protein